MTISISNYGQGASDNNPNTIRVDVGETAVWFSYRVPVAFLRGGIVVTRQNDWGPTTGKHLNWIDDGDKKSRLPGSAFLVQLADVLDGKAVTV